MDDPLLQAAEGGDAATCLRLLRSGAFPNCRDEAARTPLHLACVAGDVDCARVLSDFGAAVHARDEVCAHMT